MDDNHPPQHTPAHHRGILTILQSRLMLLILLGIATVAYVYASHLPEGVLRAPLSSTNVLRLVLIGTFFMLAVFWTTPGKVLFERATQVLVPITAILIVLYVAIDAPGADGLAREDRLIEDFSFLFLMFGAAAMIVVMVQLFRWKFRFAAVLALLLAFVFFIIGMEEVSWFQHVLEYESTDFFRENNSQGETNFHNLYSHESEDIFYLGGFILLVVLPFFREPLADLLERSGFASLRVLLPSAWLLVPFVIAGAFVAPFFISRSANVTIALGSIIILIGFALRSYRQREMLQAGYAAFMLALFVGIIAFCLGFDFEAREVRPWLGKEYQEFYIAWGIFAYAISVVFQLGSARRPDEPRLDASSTSIPS